MDRFNVEVPHLKGIKTTLIVLSTIGLMLCILLIVCLVGAGKDIFEEETESVLPVFITLLSVQIVLSTIHLIGVIKENATIILLFVILGVLGIMICLTVMNAKGVISGILGTALNYRYYTLLVKKKELIVQMKSGSPFTLDV